MPKLDWLDFHTTLCKWKPDRKDLAFQLLAEKDKDIHAWNPNPPWLHTYLDKPTAVATRRSQSNQTRHLMISQSQPYVSVLTLQMVAAEGKRWAFRCSQIKIPVLRGQCGTSLHGGWLGIEVYMVSPEALGNLMQLQTKNSQLIKLSVAVFHLSCVDCWVLALSTVKERSSWRFSYASKSLLWPMVLSKDVLRHSI